MSLREVGAELVGPISNWADEREKVAAEQAGLWEWVAGHPVVVKQPALRDWVESVRRNGLVEGSVARTRESVEQALTVLAELPATGVPMPVLADGILHDPHALDEGTRYATLALKALAAIYDVPVPADAQERRRLWERAGVADDALSSVVLAAGIRPVDAGVAGAVLRACADAGHAAALTLGQLRATTWGEGLPGTVWVVENPSILALALRRFGTQCPLVVCTSGWPNSAGILLLTA